MASIAIRPEKILTGPYEVTLKNTDSVLSGESLWDGKVFRTHNRTGYARNFVDPFVSEYSRSVHNDDRTIAIDIGCGIGANVALLASLGWETIYAVDPDQYHIEIAKRLVQDTRHQLMRGTQITYLEDRLPNLESLRGKASFISISQVLHYLLPTDISGSMIRIAQSLKQGGVCVISASSIWANDFSYYREEYRTKRDSGDRFPGYISSYFREGRSNHNPGFVTCFDETDFMAIAREVGLKLIDYSYLNLTSVDGDDKDPCSHVVAALTMP